MLVFALTLNAQTQTLNSQLKLATVNQGSASDSILVRGEDKIVKYVEKSDLMFSSYVPAMLQGEGQPSGNNVVSDWMSAQLPRNTIYFDNTTGIFYAYDFGSSDWVKIGGNTSNLQETTLRGNVTTNGITVNDNAIFVKHANHSNEERIVLEAGGINFIKDAMEYGGTLKLPESTGSWRNWDLPDASGTIALLSDIPAAPAVKRYVASINLDGTNNPTAYVFENTLGLPINFIKGGTGQFFMYTTGMLPGGYSISDLSKLHINVTARTTAGASPCLVTFNLTGASNELVFHTYNSGVTPPAKTDYTELGKIMIELTIYP